MMTADPFELFGVDHHTTNETAYSKQTIEAKATHTHSTQGTH